ncbi:6-pyruvoyl tetrahydrobiopterin synthase (PTPS) [Methylacidimicrobium sp. AP8]|uniref:6-carboxytetrahydropterin synthase QueD n=1 Tax=Methylacidimicrobium sp. AP8 TaxID=2730359 RepID=UPI0018BFFA26|nr:6-carboxytetrahydropterin synthase QueD [Methylacidimicrobium sp. AP8]CAB4244175.1 6-pyruvoyl tetrahydrobiopterin synthase (PTPS) [Methylacidimicrobium sp. AP8]
MRVTLEKDFGFEAAQQLPSFPEGHKCRRLHGHSFQVRVAVTGEVDPASGILYDHARISRAIEPLLAQLDHRLLNEIPGLENPTIESMARWFWERLEPLLPGLSRITICETPQVRCHYDGPSRS